MYTTVSFSRIDYAASKIIKLGQENFKGVGTQLITKNGNDKNARFI